MNFKVEEIFMVIVAFLIGWFLRTIFSVNNNNDKIKTIGSKHTKRGGCGEAVQYINKDTCEKACCPAGKCVLDTYSGKGRYDCDDCYTCQ
jgi:hypothetical protein